uniref:Uncharacterized protein n=1 Tax=Candidatus Kentrum sp. TC TaxID=2126339 RepID=A0A450YSX6_9GAMM|nr:MAG: hypothetical protein BECKTC1821E_GA0114239_103823 [Candidatus Kentron sp. TC]
MREDPIVAEIRKFRAAHTAKYDHDLDCICAALREKQAKKEFVGLFRQRKKNPHISSLVESHAFFGPSLQTNGRLY